MIECHSSVVRELEVHLKRHILRSRVKVLNISQEFDIWSLWGPNSSFDGLKVRDPRHSDLGLRVIVPHGETGGLRTISSGVCAPESSVFRTKHVFSLQRIA